MYIHEAVKAALEKGCLITFRGDEDVEVIKPTNTQLGCIGCNPADGTPIIPRWQPGADELMRDDYVLVDIKG